MSEEWVEKGVYVIFPAHGWVKHKIFVETYKGLSYAQARRKMNRLGFTKGEQRTIIRYLKSIGHDLRD